MIFLFSDFDFFFAKKKCFLYEISLLIIQHTIKFILQLFLLLQISLFKQIKNSTQRFVIFIKQIQNFVEHFVVVIDLAHFLASVIQKL